MIASWRSLLLTPAIDRARLSKAHLRGADALILDLEDGVARESKAAARQSLPKDMDRLASLGSELLVRINAEPDQMAADLDAAIRPGLQAIVSPKAEDASLLRDLVARIRALESARHLEPGGIGLVALIESARGLEKLSAIASVPGMAALALGVEDFALSLGVEPDPENLDLPCRLIALAAAAHGLAAIGAPAPLARFDRIEAFHAAATRARKMGLTGTLCIHPKQVEAANRAFAPSEAEIALASQILAAWAANPEKGVIRLGDRMIDAPLVRRAEQLMQKFRRLNQTAP